MSDQKAANIQFFRAELPTLLANPLFRQKFVVVSEREVKAWFDTFDAALRHAVANYSNDEFIVQQVVDESATVSFVHAAL